MSVQQHYSWEENTERRLGIVENKVDKLLDPEIGIYPKLADLGDRLQRWAIALLTTLLIAVVLELVQWATR